MRVVSIRVIATATALTVACSNNPTAPFSPAYNPVLPTDWAASVTNPYFPLTPGTTWQYREQTATGGETITVEVLPERRVVNGAALGHFVS